MNKMMETEKLATATTSDPRWQSIVARQEIADGKFFYSVKTTGVYCRPSCAASPPAAGKRTFSPKHRRCGESRLSRLQEVQAYWSDSGGHKRGEDREGLPAH